MKYKELPPEYQKLAREGVRDIINRWIDNDYAENVLNYCGCKPPYARSNSAGVIEMLDYYRYAVWERDPVDDHDKKCRVIDVILDTDNRPHYKKMKQLGYHLILW